VIFTFDGDAAGQKAALRAFGGDQNFVSQTYVAVEPSGMDPCDLRIKNGDAAVRELVARRVPLYRFVLANTVSKYDLDRADGRVDALREAARLVSSIRDRSKVDAFSRELAGMIGVDVEEARAEVRRAVNRPQPRGDQRQDQRPDRRAGQAQAQSDQPPPGPPRKPVPDLRDPRFALERETLKLVIQYPMAIGRTTAEVGANDFTHPTYRAVWELMEKNGGPAAADADWASRIRSDAADLVVRSAITELGVEPLKTAKEPDAAFVAGHVYRLQELTALRRIAEVKSRLQRTNPVDQATEYNRMFGELVALEQHRRTLRELSMGTVS
jgi:DNA primase